MKKLSFFVAGAVSAFAVGAVVIEFWVHFMEHTAYTKAAR